MACVQVLCNKFDSSLLGAGAWNEASVRAAASALLPPRRVFTA
jgi:hypothetical protein